MCLSRVYLNNNLDLNANNDNLANSNDNGRMAQMARIFYINMRTYNNLYPEIYSLRNLILAWKKARKGKTKKNYVIEFEKNLAYNLKRLHYELRFQKYRPLPLKTFILRDPKTRKISKSDFRDRIVHHALCNIIEPIFEKTFIYDSYASRKGKGNLLAIKRFYKFMRKVSKNGKTNGWFNENQIKGYCLKADIKHYFEEVDHEILSNIIQKRIKDEKVLWLSKRVTERETREKFKNKGMPLGNLTSQFFANIYLNELDKFVKHELRAKYYIRYVDDFVILHYSKSQLKIWKRQIEEFLKRKLKLELHPEKSRIIPLSRGVDFVGFRNFYYFRLLRKRNIKNMKNKIRKFSCGEIGSEKIDEIFQGWDAYAKWADAFNVRIKIFKEISKIL